MWPSDSGGGWFVCFFKYAVPFFMFDGAFPLGESTFHFQVNRMASFVKLQIFYSRRTHLLLLETLRSLPRLMINSATSDTVK